MSDYLLEAQGLTKNFGGLRAVDHVSLGIKQGEVLGLVGDNGAGKSTLIKMLTGVFPPDAGTILLEGNDIVFRNRQHARELGIECVYQDLALVDTLDGPSNLFLGAELYKSFLGFKVLDNRKMREEAVRVLKERMSITLGKVKDPVLFLSGGQKQSVAIARAIYSEKAQVLILDEPTAALGPEETEKVLSMVGRLAAQGLGIVMIAHNLEHVLQVCDRIAVLWQGQLAGVREKDGTSRQEILGMIMGSTEHVVNG